MQRTSAACVYQNYTHCSYCVEAGCSWLMTYPANSLPEAGDIKQSSIVRPQPFPLLPVRAVTTPPRCSSPALNCSCAVPPQLAPCKQQSRELSVHLQSALNTASGMCVLCILHALFITCIQRELAVQKFSTTPLPTADTQLCFLCDTRPARPSVLHFLVVKSVQQDV